MILNTVERAQIFAQTIRTKLKDKKVLLLHSRFLMPDRLQYENQLLKYAGKNSKDTERDGLIVVGTQVIEQSLDYDVDYMISDLCPMDLLLQRIGRLHRHANHDQFRPSPLKEAQCGILGDGIVFDKGSKYVYGAYLLMRTNAFLPQCVSLPKDISPLVQKVYDPEVKIDTKISEYDTAYKEHVLKLQRMKKEANTFRLRAPNGIEKDISQLLECSIPPDDDHARAQVRNGDASLQILLLLKHEDGKITRLPWLSEGECWYQTECPSVEDCRKIAAQRITLPADMFKDNQCIDDISELQMPEAWCQSTMLRYQRLLLLNENLEGSINDRHMQYSRINGMQLIDD